MNLIIDIGNTLAKYAVFEKDELLEVVYDSNKTLENMHQLIDKYSIDSAIIASVIPLNKKMLDALSQLTFR